MGKIFTREDCLQIDIEAYNRAVELSWRKDIVAKNLSGRLSDCKYCGRKYVVCCICDEAVKRWDALIVEAQEISNMIDELI